MMEEILEEKELAHRMGTTVEMVRTWAREGKFNKNVSLEQRDLRLYIKYNESDAVSSLRKVDRILDEMENGRQD